MKKTIIYIITIIVSVFTGFVGMYALMYYYPQNVINNVSKNEVTVTDKGISEGIKKIYDAVIVVESYKDGNLIGTGTGFIYGKEKDSALIMTNHHVIENSGEIKIIYSNDNIQTAILVGSDEYADIAVLKVNSESILSVANLGNNNDLNVGDTVFTIGAPMGKEYKGTVTRGILSGTDRFVSVSTKSGGSNDWIMKLMQTDAAINPGNSGGPLCNVNGDVIGITSMKIVESSVEGIGFAIPIDDAKAIADSILKGDLERPYIGIEMISVSEKYALLMSKIDISKDITSGVAIINTIENGPARIAGLEKGDVITKIGEHTVNNVAEFRYYLYKYKVGDIVEIKINRNSEIKVFKIKLEKNI